MKRWRSEASNIGVYDNNHERHLPEFRKIKELPYKSNKWTGKRNKLQEYCVKSTLEDISCQKF